MSSDIPDIWCHIESMLFRYQLEADVSVFGGRHPILCSVIELVNRSLAKVHAHHGSNPGQTACSEFLT